MILKANGKIIASDVEFAKSLITQTRGLMFRKPIPDSYALIFVMKKPKKVSIHMLFVTFPIDVLFLDENKNILKTSRLSPWTGMTSSNKKVKYIIEMTEGTISKYGLEVGKHIFFEE